MLSSILGNTADLAIKQEGYGLEALPDVREDHETTFTTDYRSGAGT
jgi:hypothetical protein